MTDPTSNFGLGLSSVSINASTDVTELVENTLLSENDELLMTICYDLTKKLQSCGFLVGQEFLAQIARHYIEILTRRRIFLVC